MFIRETQQNTPTTNIPLPCERCKNASDPSHGRQRRWWRRRRRWGRVSAPLPAPRWLVRRPSPVPPLPLPPPPPDPLYRELQTPRDKGQRPEADGEGVRLPSCSRHCMEMAGTGEKWTEKGRAGNGYHENRFKRGSAFAYALATPRIIGRHHSSIPELKQK